MAAPAAAQPLVAPTEALSPAEQREKFHLPPGFEIQLFAAEPAIHKPMNITFDRQGRLWVTDTRRVSLSRERRRRASRHGEDSGRYQWRRAADEITTFVDKLEHSAGRHARRERVVVYGIPSINRCLDTDGDGRADTREVLYANFGHRDTHGMVNSFTRGLDGWLYACHGFANDSSPAGDRRPARSR